MPTTLDKKIINKPQRVRLKLGMTYIHFSKKAVNETGRQPKAHIKGFFKKINGPGLEVTRSMTRPGNHDPIRVVYTK